ncbi:MAG: hypothetical protein FD147_1237 [Chloroflexi bacterium]|nr:MAG: hypothetical protein FD147_1237 [Chloroflexota bacterium]
MNKFPDNSLILVTIMPNKKDFEIARLLGWYRIPLRMAPKIIDVDFLAFYQTDNFGVDHRWMIEYFATVHGHELTTRSALLRDEKSHPKANEEYYKIQIGTLQRLDSPLHADKWKRITFIYTLGSLFNQAGIINDLVVRSDEREVLWKNLRERNQTGYNHNNSSLKEQIPDKKLLMLITDLSKTQSDLDFSDI